MYMIPICFASVVRSTRASAEPLIGCRTGQGRVTIGFGTTVVMASSGGLRQPTRPTFDATPIKLDPQPLWGRRRCRSPDGHREQRMWARELGWNASFAPCSLASERRYVLLGAVPPAAFVDWRRVVGLHFGPDPRNCRGYGARVRRVQQRR